MPCFYNALHDKLATGYAAAQRAVDEYARGDLGKNEVELSHRYPLL